MLSRTDIVRFAATCRAIGNEVSDDFGFVPVRNLLSRFSAQLLIRPLLVEGMLASVEDSGRNGSNHRWAVLIDSETYRISELHVDQETHERPLPSRLRNTIAHELVHSLAFRPAEFGIRLRIRNATAKINANVLVAAIERETEKLSPLLLWSEKALAGLLARKREQLSLEDLTEVRASMGISRHVLINRLRLLSPTDSKDFRHHIGLRNLAIGMAEWTENGSAVLRSWPVFFNFDKNHVPSFLLRVARQDRLPAKEIFTDESFAMCGGSSNTLEFMVEAGSEEVRNARRLEVECNIESGSRRAGTEFLYVIRRRGVPSLIEI